MPHLQFDINFTLKNQQRIRFIEFVKSKFSYIMKTGTSHIAISLREHDINNINLGRAEKGDLICLMNLDIRKGRSKEQIEELVKTYINAVKEQFSVKTSNQYVTITTHEGEDFQLIEGGLKNYEVGDDPLN